MCNVTLVDNIVIISLLKYNSTSNKNNPIFIILPSNTQTKLENKIIIPNASQIMEYLFYYFCIHISAKYDF